MKPRIMFLLNSIDVDRGGLTHASMRQASTFAEAGYDTQILTFHHEPRFPIICKQLVKMGKVSKKVKIRNMFDDRALYTKRDKINVSKMRIDISDYAKDYAISKREGRNAYRLYKNGMYEKYISLREDDTLDFIDYFNDSLYRIKKESYNYYGDLTTVRYYSFEENKVTQKVFYDKNGRTFLTFWYDPKAERTSRVISLGDNNEIVSETTGDEIPHKLDWLNSVIQEKENEAVIISDTRSTDQLLVELNDDQVKTVLRPHSNHLKKPNDPESELNKHNGYAIKNIANVDALAVLTEKQRNDIINRFGHEDKVFVIPNYYEVNTPKVRGVRSLMTNVKHYNDLRQNRDMYKAVIIARFSSVKNIHHAIKAFKKVIGEVPQAKLEIWGKGEKKEEFIKLIEELGIQDNVEIKGYTRNPEKVYRSAALSVVTSSAEGFSLSVMESMANDTPVVSYNIRYGPSDMIEDGKSGFLVKKGDIDALAKNIIYMLKNPEETRNMGIEAGKSIKSRFSYENYQNLWFSLVENLLVNDESRGKNE